jgi:hypothetical protein
MVKFVKTAEEMATESNKAIQDSIKELQSKMIEQGYNPDEWGIATNLEEFLEDPNIGFICWAVKRHG